MGNKLKVPGKIKPAPVSKRYAHTLVKVTQASCNKYLYIGYLHTIGMDEIPQFPGGSLLVLPDYAEGDIGTPPCPAGEEL